MKRQIRRLLIASGLSLLSLAITFFWYYRMGQKTNSHGLQKPVAQVEQVKDEIERRPVTRMVWQLINEGEPVYPGEAIRTSSSGEVRIQFLDSSRYIDLEAGSLIIISQSSQNEISLDLLDGSVMVNQGSTAEDSNTAGPALTLKSGEAKVDLSKATASLSKSQSGQIDLRVIKGKAKVENQGQAQEIDSGKIGAISEKGISAVQNPIVILSPLPDQPFSLNLENPEPVLFSWKGTPEKSLVSLHIGENRNKLKPLGETSNSQFSFKLNAGKYAWKLVAKDPQTQKVIQESPIYRLEIVPRLSPVLISPAADEKIIKASSDQKMNFTWIRPAHSQAVRLEVSSDAEMKNTVLSALFENQESHQESLEEGTYFIRLSARFDSSGKEVHSQVQRFQWSSKPLPPPMTLEWNESETKNSQTYVHTPEAFLSWVSSNPKSIHTYRVKLADSENLLGSESALVFESKDPKFKAPLKEPGSFAVLIEALDEKKNVLARSSVKPIEIKPLPLLPSPKILPDAGDLNANNQGRLDLQWSAVDGAKEYKVIFYDASGKEKKAATFKKNSTALVNLLPGNFQIEVRAVDPYGRLSEKTETRTVRVPASSGLSSPKIRKMKVK